MWDRKGLLTHPTHLTHSASAHSEKSSSMQCMFHIPQVLGWVLPRSTAQGTPAAGQELRIQVGMGPWLGPRDSPICSLPQGL